MISRFSHYHDRVDRRERSGCATNSGDLGSEQYDCRSDCPPEDNIVSFEDATKKIIERKVYEDILGIEVEPKELESIKDKSE